MKLESNDYVQFDVPTDSVLMSGTIRNLIDDLDGETDVEVPLEVDGATLQKVIDYLNEHVRDAPERDPKDLTPFDKELFGVRSDNSIENIQELYLIMEAANYLAIPSLLEASTISVANAIRGRKPEEMRAILQIQA